MVLEPGLFQSEDPGLLRPGRDQHKGFESLHKLQSDHPQEAGQCCIPAP